MTDAISRWSAINTVMDALTERYGEDAERSKVIHDALMSLPAAESPRGFWVTIERGEQGYSAGDFRCSICGKPNKCYTITAFCPNCGAKMEGKR